MEALFADSVKTGDRSNITNWKSVLQTLGSGTGPMLTIILFLVLGDQWSTEGPTGPQPSFELKVIFTVGNGIKYKKIFFSFSIVFNLVPIIILHFFKDSEALNKESEGIFEDFDNSSG